MSLSLAGGQEYKVNVGGGDSSSEEEYPAAISLSLETGISFQAFIFGDFTGGEGAFCFFLLGFL